MTRRTSAIRRAGIVVLLVALAPVVWLAAVEGVGLGALILSAPALVLGLLALIVRQRANVITVSVGSVVYGVTASIAWAFYLSSDSSTTPLMFLWVIPLQLAIAFFTGLLVVLTRFFPEATRSET